MQGYLLDTNAISLVAPGTDTKRLTPGRAGFQRWIRAHSDNLFCSVITLAEVQAGISRLQRKDASRRAADLAHWLDAIVELYESRFLPLTVPVALEAGRLPIARSAAASTQGSRTPPLPRPRPFTT